MTATAANDIQPDGFFTQSLAERDPEIAGWIGKELQRQQEWPSSPRCRRLPASFHVHTHA